MKPTLLLLAFTSSLFAAERPVVTVPRQTGNTAVQPKWRERLYDHRRNDEPTMVSKIEPDRYADTGLQ